MRGSLSDTGGFVQAEYIATRATLTWDNWPHIATHLNILMTLCCFVVEYDDDLEDTEL